VIDVLGRGANGVTYRCLDRRPINTTITSDSAPPSHQHEVAVKALSLRGLRNWKQLELFKREAQILKNLDHSCIPKYLEYFEEEEEGESGNDNSNDQSFFLVQDLVVGKNLEDAVLKDGWRCDEETAFLIASQLLETLTYLKSRRPPVIHRDIKPENIVLSPAFFDTRNCSSTSDSDGDSETQNNNKKKVFLVDFGGVQAAKTAADDKFGSTIVGTYGYQAPESFRGAAQPASDVYGLGGTLLFLLTGQPPSAFPLDRLAIDFSRAYMSDKMRGLVEGLLEPVAEDRLSAEEALGVVRGDSYRRGQMSSSSGNSRQVEGRRWRSTGELIGSKFSQPQQQQQQQQQQQPGLTAIGGNSNKVVPRRQPVGSNITVLKKGRLLTINIPPAGIGGTDMATGAFAIAWNAFVAIWTVGAFTGGGILFALFSLPFWFAGFQIAKQAVGRSFIRERLEIGPNRWRLKQEIAVIKADSTADWDGGSGKVAEGQTRDLVSAEAQVYAVVNDVPQYHVVLKEGVNEYVFGEGLKDVEQEWLVAVIESHLNKVLDDDSDDGDKDIEELEAKEADGWEKRLAEQSQGWQKYGDAVAQEAQAEVRIATAKAAAEIDSAARKAKRAAGTSDIIPNGTVDIIIGDEE
jgi:serine/threonine protein kinase